MLIFGSWHALLCFIVFMFCVIKRVLILRKIAELDYFPAWRHCCCALFRDILRFLRLYEKSAKILFLGLDNAGKTILLHMLHSDRLESHGPTFNPQTVVLEIGTLLSRGAQSFEIGGCRLYAIDLGGMEFARRLWKDYYSDIDAVVFMVDAADRERFGEAQQVLQDLLQNPALREVPFLVLGNKIDRPVAASADELRHYLALDSPIAKKGDQAVIIALHEDGDEWCCVQLNGNEVARVPCETAYERICEIVAPNLQCETSDVLLMRGDEIVQPQQKPQAHVELFMCSVLRRCGYADGFEWLCKKLRFYETDFFAGRAPKCSQSIKCL